MTISTLGGVSAVTPQPQTSSAPETAARSTSTPHRGDVDQVTLQPLPPRFPWLSRLSTELEKASGQPAPFSPAPVLGDHLDSKA